MAKKNGIARIVLSALLYSFFVLSCSTVPFQTGRVLTSVGSSYSLDSPLSQCEVAQIVDRFLTGGSDTHLRRVLVLGYDGVRLDALVAAETPLFIRFFDRGGFRPMIAGEGGQRTMSGPGWASILTGNLVRDHGFATNTTMEMTAGAVSFLFRAKEIDPLLRTASVVHWPPINRQILRRELDSINIHLETDDDLLMRDRVVEIIRGGQADVIFAVFDDPDHAGHLYGFSPEENRYLKQIRITDRYGEEIYREVMDREERTGEEWLLLVVTDHGGLGRNHGGQSPAEKMIWILSNRSDVFNAL